MQPLLEQLGFSGDPSSQQVLLDDGSTRQRPTLANMRAAIAWLVEDASAGDALFLHYSGHGGRTQDGGVYHETLCPVDMNDAGMLYDSELFETLVKPLPSGCRLTCILDSCHSGGALDLPFLFTGTQENLHRALAGEAVQMAMSRNWAQDLSAWREGNRVELLSDVAGMGLGLWQLWGKYKSSKGADQSGFRADEAENVGVAVGEVIAITGCASDQTSADVGDVSAQFQLGLQPTARGGAGGALTSAFCEAMEGSGSWSYLQLLEHIRKRLSEEGFAQVPQLASSLVVDLNQPFTVDTVTLPAAAQAGAGRGYDSSQSATSGFLSSLAVAPAGAAMMQAFAGRGGDDGNGYGTSYGGGSGNRSYGEGDGYGYADRDDSGYGSRSCGGAADDGYAGEDGGGGLLEAAAGLFGGLAAAVEEYVDEEYVDEEQY